MTSRGLLSSAAEAYGLPPGLIAPELGPGAASETHAVGIDWSSVDPQVFGRIYEQQVLARQTASRKAQGAFYTPPAVARLLVEQAVPLADPAPGGLPEILDPACGCGGLLVEALAFLCRRRGADVLTAVSRLRGLDRDLASVVLARLALLAAAHGFGVRGRDLAGVARCLVRQVLPRDAVRGDLPAGAHCVLMNPPYVRAATAGEDRHSLRRRYQTAAGAFDLHIPFVELAVRSTRPGGSLGLLTSDKFLVADYGRKLRALLAEQVQLLRLISLADCDDASPGALVAQVATVAVRGRPEQGHRVEVLHPRALAEIECRSARTVRLAQGDLLLARWPTLRADSAEQQVVATMTSGSVRPLGSMALVRGGVRGFDYGACCRQMAEAQGLPDEMPVLCPGNIRAYRAPSGHSVRLARRGWRAPCLRSRPDPVSSELWQLCSQPKLAIKGVGRRPTAALVNGPAMLLVAVWGVWAEPELLYPLLALLNSRPAAWLHYQQLYTARIPRGSLRIPLSWVAAFPVPATGLRELDSLGRRRIGAATAAEGHSVQEEIDLAAAKAYGLGTDELHLMAQAPLGEVQD